MINILNEFLPYIRGEAEITKYKAKWLEDEKTWVPGEVVEVIKKKNTICYSFLISRNNDETSIAIHFSDAADNTQLNRMKIGLSEKKMKGPFCWNPSGWTGPDVHVSGPTYTPPSIDGVTPGEWVATKRFNQPISNRNWRSISILPSSTTSSHWLKTISCVTLATPCVQTTEEILDVTYRVYVDVSRLYASSIPSGKRKILLDIAQKFFILTDGSNTNDRTLGWPTNMRFTWAKLDNELARPIAFPLEISPGAATTTRLPFSGIRTFGVSNTAFVNAGFNGELIGSYVIHNQGDFASLHCGPIVPEGTSPIQNTYFRKQTNISGAGNNKPFIDTTYLAVGSGRLIIQPTTSGSWKKQDALARLYKVEFTNGGNATTGTYKIKKRVFGRCTNSNFSPSVMNISNFQSSSIQNTSSVVVPPLVDVMDDTYSYPKHGIGFSQPVQLNSSMVSIMGRMNGAPYAQRYIYPEIILADSNGITFARLDVKTSENLDSSSTPSLPVTGINQIDSSSSDGTVYVACRNTGLWKVTRNLTNIGDSNNPIYTGGTTTAVNNVAPAGTSGCVGVVIKRNTGAIWAIFRRSPGNTANGRFCLAFSTNGGTSWTEYDETTSFKFALANYTPTAATLDFQSFVINHTHANTRIAVQLDPTDLSGSNRKVMYYELETSSVTSDSTVVTMTESTETTSPSLGQYLNSSRSIWLNSNSELFFRYNSSTVFFCTYRAWKQTTAGTSTGDSSTSGGRYYCFSSVGFDPIVVSGNEYVIGKTDTSSTTVNNNAVVLRNMATQKTSAHTDVSYLMIKEAGDVFITPYNGTGEDGFHIITYAGNGVLVGMAKTNNTNEVPLAFANSATYSLNWGLVVCAGSSQSSGDYFLENTPGIWESYGWNGSAWVKDHAGSKTMHTAVQPIIDGLSISFQNNAGGVSTEFIAGEFAQCYVFDGLIKDDATTMTSFTAQILFGPSSRGTNFQTTTVPAESTHTATDEPLAMMKYYIGSDSYTFSEPGVVGAISTASSTSSTVHTATIAEHRLVGNFTLKYKPFINQTNTPSTDVYPAIGLLLWSNVGTFTSYTSGSLYSTTWVRNNDAHTDVTVKVRSANGTVVGTYNFTDFSETDEYSIQRTGTTLEFKRNGTTYHSIAGVATTDWAIYTQFSNQQSGMFYDCKVTYSTTNRSYINCGQSSNQTGSYSPDFRCLAYEFNSSAWGLKLNGTPVTLLTDGFTPPAAGQIQMLYSSGRLWFNSADAGKTLTGNWFSLSKINV